MNWVRISVKSALISLVTVLVLVPGSVSAQAAALLVPYEGFLTNAVGQPIDTTQNMTFRFFADETGGTSLFEESKDVTVEDGVFQTNIGDTSPIPADLAGQELFLEIEIFGDSSPLSPRQRIRIPGVDANFFQQRVNETCPEGSSIRAISISGTVTCETDDIGGGGGGGIGGSGTVNRVAKFTGTTTLGDSGIFEDALGKVGIGTTSPSKLLTLSSSNADILLDTICCAAPDTNKSNIIFQAARGTEASREVVQSGDELGQLDFHGFVGGDPIYQRAAQIRIRVDGAPGVGLPGSIEFRTTPEDKDKLEKRMVIDSEGNVGIGTTDPKALLDVQGNALLGTGTNNGTFGAVTIRAPDDADAILGVHSPNKGILQIGWDASAARGTISADSGGDIAFITDATVTPGDPWDGKTPKIIIKGNGNVGIGTAAPAVRLEVVDTIDGNVLRLQDSNGTCDHNPESGAETVSCASDARLKTNIKDARPVLDDLMTLRVRDYTVIASGDEMTGLVAQEVQEVMPGLVSEGDAGYLMVSEINHWKLVKAIQELKMENDDLRARLDGLEWTVVHWRLCLRVVCPTLGCSSAGWPSVDWCLEA